jgi:hypothetical protein
MRIWKSEHERFTARYHGRGASNYEEARQGAKWQAEEAVFDELYGRVRPLRLLDCPVGTGRFIERYVRDGVSALGVDLSDDMLAEAAKRIPPGADVRLRKGDILDPNGAPALGTGYDLIVCVRFVYAVEKSRLPVLFGNFAATGARHLLVGVRMWPEETTAVERLIWRLWNPRKRRPRWPFSRSRRYVPVEAELLRLFLEGGWSVMERREVVEKAEGFGRYFFLLRNGAAETKCPRVGQG